MPHLVRVAVRATLRASAAAGLLLAWVAPVAAQLGPVPREWNLVPRHLPGVVGTAVWDERRQRVVLLEGTRTWEWDGSGWFLHAPRSLGRPPQLARPNSAYDAARRQTVVFGATPAGQPQTWVFDGVAWRQRNPVHTPTGRTGHGMAYDAVRQLVILTGGSSGQDETWTWNGTDWTLLRTRTTHGLAWCSTAYDAHRQRTVAVGHGSRASRPVTVWEWDGVDWADRTTTPRPIDGLGALAYDPVARRCVYYDGHGRGTMASWDGIVWDVATEPPWWRLVFPREHPYPRISGALAYDGASGRMLMVGGTNLASFAETWHWRGSWRLAQTVSPAGRFNTATAYHAATGEILLYGGAGLHSEALTSDCWAFDGWRWRQLKPRRLPGPRSGHQMVHDAARSETVLFGGWDKGTFAPASTWLFSAGNWHERVVSPNPGQRSHAAMAYDSARSRVILFGGVQRGAIAPRDTWEWDGVRWLQRAPTTVPTEDQLELAYDAARQRVVGVGYSGTWEWDGQNWRGFPRQFPVSRPEVIAYDPRLRRVVAVSFASTSHHIASWDGTGWQPIGSGSRPVYEGWGGRMHYHEAADSLIFLQSGGTDTYAIGPTPSARSFGSPCAAVVPAPQITATAASVGRPCRIDILDARPQSLAALGLSATAQATSIGPCTLQLGQPAWLIPLATDAAGFASALLPLPPIPGLRATQLFAQGFALDPRGSALGLAFTAGLQLTLGD